MFLKIIKFDLSDWRKIRSEIDSQVENPDEFIGIFEKLDENLDENYRVKRWAEDVNIFETVNKLRQQRPHMINTFSNYRLLYLCLVQYGKNKAFYDNLKLKSSPVVSATKKKVVIKKKTTTDETTISGPIYANDIKDDFFDDYEIDDVEYALQIWSHNKINYYCTNTYH